MSFTIANWACTSSSLNQGQETVTPFGGVATVLNAPNQFAYGSPTDNVAAISAANYFLPIYADLSVGDWIFVNGSDASNILIVLTVSKTGVTTGSFAPTGTVGTANIINNAVTYAKIQQETASTLLGNPTGSLANVSEITLGSGLAFSGTSLQLASTSLNYVAVPITAAQWNGMFAAPKLLVAAGGANTLIVVDKIALAMTFVSAAYAAGGVVLGQYDSTINGAGNPATGTEPAADFFSAVSKTFVLNGSVSTGAAFTTSVNKGLYLSNQTGAFTTGNGTWVAHVWYKIIPTV